ncbi:MAG: PilW family protein [Marinobacter sp.]
MTCQKPMPLKQSGLSIVELMIALLLGSLLAIGLFQIFTSNSQAFRVTEGIARTQESGRIASDILAREARNAGYFGCNSQKYTSNLDIEEGDDDWDVFHWDMSTSVSSPAAARPSGAINGTDFIYFNGMESLGLEIATDSPHTSASMDIRNAADDDRENLLSDGEIVAITDCQGTDVFQITSFNSSNGNLVANSGNKQTPGNDFTDNVCSNTGNPGAGNNCLSNNYGEGAQILRPFQRIYFIDDSGTTGNRALMMEERLSGTVRTYEIVEGVEDLQVRYGLSGGPEQPVNQWTDAESVNDADWGNVRAVRVSILVRGGADNLFDDSVSVCFPAWADCSSGNNYDASDNRMYRVYSFTTNVRNKSN